MSYIPYMGVGGGGVGAAATSCNGGVQDMRTRVQEHRDTEGSRGRVCQW